MSRFYTYSRPKNQRSDGAHDEPWCVEPLKIRNRREKFQSEPLREKKVRKDENRVRLREEENLSSVSKRHKSEKGLVAIGDEEEQERSDLTEEHGVRSQGFCYSLGTSSSYGSSDRDKDESISSASGQRRNIIRIRLPSRKPKDADEAHLRSISGRENVVPQQEEKSPIQLSRQNSASSLGHKISISIPESVSCFDKASCTSGSKNKGSAIFEEAVPTIESLYKSLIEDWVPPILHPEQVGVDEDWLFWNKVQARKIKRVDAPCIWSKDLCPRARYLPDADLCALPFTVPF